MVKGTFEFKGRGLSFLWLQLWTSFLVLVTVGLFFPWAYSAQQRWEAVHTYVNDKRLVFRGTGGGFFGNWLLISFLTIITVGLYAPWAYCRIMRWKTENLYIVEPEDYAREIGENPVAAAAKKSLTKPGIIVFAAGVVLFAIDWLVLFNVFMRSGWLQQMAGRSRFYWMGGLRYFIRARSAGWRGRYLFVNLNSLSILLILVGIVLVIVGLEKKRRESQIPG
jgi:uncharacterized membrane protein YjgN (DUF898 family)